MDFAKLKETFIILLASSVVLADAGNEIDLSGYAKDDDKSNDE